MSREEAVMDNLSLYQDSPITVGENSLLLMPLLYATSSLELQ